MRLAGAIPQHAYTIPYHFTDVEAQAWLQSQSGNAALQAYLSNPASTPAGIMVPDGYSQIIVWLDASGKLHVIDATNMSVTQHVNDAVYQSPDSSVVQNALQELTDSVAKLKSAASLSLDLSPYVLLAVAGLWLFSVLPRR
jgi:hypothetical protein